LVEPSANRSRQIVSRHVEILEKTGA
jgi:hypothetical protein